MGEDTRPDELHLDGLARRRTPQNIKRSLTRRTTRKEGKSQIGYRQRNSRLGRLV